MVTFIQPSTISPGMGSYLLSFRVVGLLLRQSETAADKTRAREGTLGYDINIK